MSKERRISWKCPDCCALIKKGGDNTSTPARAANDSQNVTLRKKSVQPPSDPTNSEVKELTAELRLLTKEISSLKQRLEVATESLTRCHERLDELGVAVAANESRIQAVETSTKEILELKCTVSQLQKELNSQAQGNLCNEVEISGIPESQNENLHHILLLATRKIGIDINDSDIDWVSRVGGRKSVTRSDDDLKAPRPIVARLLRRSKRDQVLRASKSRKNITSTDLEIPGSPYKVYFNERLTKENRMLFRDARTKSKANGYAYCWCSRGSIYVRQREGKAATQISSFGDLNRLFGAYPEDPKAASQ